MPQAVVRRKGWSGWRVKFGITTRPKAVARRRGWSGWMYLTVAHVQLRGYVGYGWVRLAVERGGPGGKIVWYYHQSKSSCMPQGLVKLEG